METKLNIMTESVMKPLGERSEIDVSNVIHGFLPYSKDSNIEIESIDIFLDGFETKIDSVKPDLIESGAVFVYTNNAKARAGSYTAVWNTKINGKLSPVISKFTMKDELDRTIPLELAYLS